MTTPKKIGVYEILDALRAGPRPLYRAKAPDGRILALKTISAQGITSDARERFNRETTISTELDHPNLVRVYDYGEADGVLFQAMDLLEGADLRKVIAERRPLSWEEKLSIMEQISAGLEFAHGRNLVHRDIKPANLFLENSGRVRVLDFGMARVEASNLTQVGMAVGTLLYMAPEQLRGETCTPATDVFAAGMVFYELATGKHPFAAGEREMGKIASAIAFQKPTPLSEAAPDAPAGLDIVLDKALQKDATRRLKTAGDLKRALTLCSFSLQLPITPAAPGASQDESAGKTVVIRRSPAPAPPKPPQPAVAPPAPPQPPSDPVKPKPARDGIFCPVCTRENPAGTAVCKYCSTPLRELPLAGSEPKPAKFDWLQVTIILLLLIVLAVLFWMIKR